MNSLDKSRLLMDIVDERGYNCEWCDRTGGEFHHMFFHGRKPDVFCKENLMIADHKCHVEDKILDTEEMRQWFWKVQCARYGKAQMDDWLMITHLNYFKGTVFKPD